ncbi:MAG TPA: 7TM diverse intracellular signaling domain-containing protein, partial [Oligoflexus sp.]|nr:7TM diverse intracellular signaling domain-containing protein [Oligoflexus sp.]
MKYYLLVSWILPLTLHAQVAIDVNKDFSSAAVHDSAVYVVDTAYSIDDVASENVDFKKLEQGGRSFLSGDSYWLKFSVHSELDKETILILSYSLTLTPEIEVYDLDSRALIEKVGYAHAFETRKIKFRTPAIPLTIKPGANAFAIRMKNDPKLTKHCSFNFRLMSMSEFYNFSHYDLAVVCLCFGLFAFAFIYNTFVYFKLKYKYYLYYILYGVNVIVCYSMYSGIGPLYLMPGISNAMLIVLITVTSGYVGMLFASLFAMEFLITAKHAPGLHRVFQVKVWIYGLFVLLSFLEFFIFDSLAFVGFMLSALSAVTVPFIILTSVICFFRGYTPAINFTISWTLLIVLSIGQNLVILGLADWFRASDLLGLLGVATELCLLSLAFGDRIKRESGEQNEQKDRLNRELKNYVEKLDHLVAEKTEEIRSIFDTVKIGIFSISDPKGLLIDGNRSKSLETILGAFSEKVYDLNSLLLSRANLSGDEVDLIVSSLSLSIGSDMISFELNAEHLPRELSLTIDGSVRMIQIDWNTTLKSDRTTVQRVFVSVKDVTELKKYQEVTSSQAREIRLIEELINVAPNKFVQFCDSSRKYLREAVELIEGPAPGNDNRKILHTAFVKLHTVKGVARTLGFRELASLVHEAENILKDLQLGEGQMTAAQVIKNIQAVDSLLEEYYTLSRDKLNRDIRLGGPIVLNPADVASIVDRFLSNESLKLMDLLPLVSFAYVPFHDLVDEMRSSLPSLAMELAKHVPTVGTQGLQEIYLTQESYAALRNVLAHISRNSMDHGIESESERLGKGKPGAGRIELKGALDPSMNLTLRISDDGGGLALEKIKVKAEAKGLLDGNRSYNRAEIAEFIFAPGFSTSARITEISGRGYGMDAVKSFIESLGGSIAIAVEGLESGGGVPFSFVITLPSVRFRRITVPQSRDAVDSRSVVARTGGDRSSVAHRSNPVGPIIGEIPADGGRWNGPAVLK